MHRTRSHCHGNQHVSQSKILGCRESYPRQKPTSRLSIPMLESQTPARHPAMLRNTGAHPFNSEPPLKHLQDEGIACVCKAGVAYWLDPPGGRMDHASLFVCGAESWSCSPALLVRAPPQDHRTGGVKSPSTLKALVVCSR